MASSSKLELVELHRIQPDSTFLSGLSSFQLKRLAELSTLRSFPPHSVVYQQGERPKEFFLIIEGLIKLFELSQGGHATTLVLISVGQVFGGQAVVGDAVNLCSAETLGSTKTLVWDGQELRHLMEQMPRLACNAYKVAYAHLSEFATRWREMVTDNVEQRIARALMRLAKKLSKQTGPEIVIDQGCSGQDLAGYAGTTMYTVSRVLHRWERQGIIRRRRTIVVVKDPNALAMIAETGLLVEPILEAVSNGQVHSACNKNGTN